MKNGFLVIKFKDILKYGLLVLAILLMVGFSARYTSKVIETASNVSRLLPIYSVETPDKKVAITFDCAWGAEDIPSIIDTLEYNNINATFFVLGTWVDKYPQEIKDLAEAGNTIGNHSNSHAHVNKLSYEANIEDMKKCNEKIEKLTGEKVVLYRGPYGEYNNTVIEAAESLEMKVIQWDIDTLDYLGKTESEMCTRIKDKIRNGSIILMHNDTENTAKSLQKIIDTIQDLGYEIVPVAEMIYNENYTINHEGRQINSSK